MPVPPDLLCVLYAHISVYPPQEGSPGSALRSIVAMMHADVLAPPALCLGWMNMYFARQSTYHDLVLPFMRQPRKRNSTKSV